MNIFILGIDGLGRGVLEHETKNIKKFMEKSTTYENMHTVYKPISAQCWGSMLLSVSPDKHGYTNDMIVDYKHEFDEFPSVFRLVSENKKEYKLHSISNWNPINTGILENIDGLTKETGDSDREVTDKIVSFIENMGENTFLFVQLDEMDAAGHKHDYFTKDYYAELDRIDGYVGGILEAIEKSGKMDNSLIILTTDHGGGAKPKSHGQDDIKDMGIFAVVFGKNYEAGKKVTDKTSVMDIAPTILNELEIQAPKHFEGKCLL